MVVDSWYASKELFEAIGETPYVAELKGNRWVLQIDGPVSKSVLPKFPKCHGGKRYQKQARKEGWKKFKEIAEGAVRRNRFTPRNDPHVRDMLVNFTHQYQLRLGFSDGSILNVLVLHDPKNRDFKFLCSNDLSLRCEDFIKLIRVRWRIEEFHKDVKDLGLGEYQLRELRTVLIHGHIALLAYSLLRDLIANSVKLFGRALRTIGECSRAIKETLLYRKPVKKWWAV